MIQQSHCWPYTLRKPEGKETRVPQCIGEGNGNPLQCSCLENPRDGGAWWAAVYGVTQSQTRRSDLAAAAAGMKLMDHIVTLCLASLGIAKMFSIMAAQTYAENQHHFILQTLEFKMHPAKMLYIKEGENPPKKS